MEFLPVVTDVQLGARLASHQVGVVKMSPGQVTERTAINAGDVVTPGMCMYNGDEYVVSTFWVAYHGTTEAAFIEVAPLTIRLHPHHAAGVAYCDANGHPITARSDSCSLTS